MYGLLLVEIQYLTGGLHPCVSLVRRTLEYFKPITRIRKIIIAYYLSLILLAISKSSLEVDRCRYLPRVLALVPLNLITILLTTTLLFHFAYRALQHMCHDVKQQCFQHPKIYFQDEVYLTNRVTANKPKAYIYGNKEKRKLAAVTRKNEHIS